MNRLTEIDALRGLAAVAVLAFHYTFKYDELYGFAGSLPFTMPWGHLGVNLFFVISGFVIFMTLERTRVPLDFVVSRTTRLYPAYWVAVLLTYLVVQILGLPGKEVSVRAALLNLTMVQQLFRVPLVDSVYWTLLVELLFYALAFVLFVTGTLHRVLAVLAALLGLRLVYWAFDVFLGIDLPWRLSQLLILQFIPLFALGIVAYRLTRDPRPRTADAAIGCFALAVLAVTDSLLMAGVALACFLAVWLAARRRLPLLRLRLFVWLGAISYPLYLLHENIGWAVLRQLQLHGFAPLAAVGITTAIALALATAVTYAVERPAMHWLRGRYKQSRMYHAAHG